MKTFDVAISYAGEERSIARRLVKNLKNNGLSVFFDEDCQSDLFGKNLYSYLQKIYRDCATFFVCLLSDNYVNKNFTMKELESAQERALLLQRENREYILPIYVDKHIDVPGISSTVSHVILAEHSIKYAADLIIEKVDKFYEQNELTKETELICNKVLQHYSFIVRHACCYGLKTRVAEVQMIVEIIDAYRSVISRYAHSIHEQLYDFIFKSLDNINNYFDGNELSLYKSLNIQREYSILLKLFEEWKKDHYDRDYNFFKFVEKLENTSNIEEQAKTDMDTVVKYLEDNENSPTTFEEYLIELSKLTLFDYDTSEATEDLIQYFTSKYIGENSFIEAKQAFDSSPLIEEMIE